MKHLINLEQTLEDIAMAADKEYLNTTHKEFQLKIMLAIAERLEGVETKLGQIAERMTLLQ